MKVLKGKKKFCAVKATTFFIELLFALEMMEKLSSVDESTPNQSDSEARQGEGHARENEIQLLFRLEAKLEWDDERTCHPGEYETFRKGMGNLSTIHNMCFAYGFQSVNALCVALADLHNLAKATFANNSGQFEIIDGEGMTLNAKSLQG